MIFQFEHLGLWSTGDTKFDVKSYKQVLNRWQKQLENVGWNALFIENHDHVVFQPGVMIKIGMNQQLVTLLPTFTTGHTFYLPRSRNRYD